MARDLGNIAIDVEFVEYDQTKYKRPGILAYSEDACGYKGVCRSSDI